MENNKINEGALTKQIKTLVMQERYEEAMKVLDEIEVSKIRNISILCLVGEVYMGLKRYDEAEQILLRVYEKNPNTRRILDLLTTLYIDKVSILRQNIIIKSSLVWHPEICIAIF